MEFTKEEKLNLLAQEKYSDIEYVKYFVSDILPELRQVYQNIDKSNEETELILRTHINPIEYEHIFKVIKRNIRPKEQPESLICLIWEDVEDYLYIIKDRLNEIEEETDKIEEL